MTACGFMRALPATCNLTEACSLKLEACGLRLEAEDI
jgi:hypothetical protein